MPNRIIKESICTSDSIDKLTAFQETLFYRLIVRCDDYGRFDGRPKIISSSCFPLRDIRTQQIEEALRALTSAELVTLYQVDGKPFLQMKTWDRHQQIRAKRSKYPAPDSETNTSDSICNQMISSDSKCPRNPIQSNPNTESEKESEVVVVGHAREELPDMDSPWEVFVREYENNIGLLPTSEVERGDLEMFFEEFTEDALGEFIRYTARKHPDNPHVYFSSICRKYLGKNIKTAQQAKAAIMDYDRQKGGRRDGVYRGGAGESPGRLYDGETIV